MYQTDHETRLALKLALITGRPLLLRGPPGSGKSSLAPYVARRLGWRYYDHVVTSRTDVTDLLWTYDAVRRLADAQARSLADDAGRVRSSSLRNADYVQPGPLWWVLDPASARRRGAPPGDRIRVAADPNDDVNATRTSPHAVLLLDEIDKADPDVPNGLLVPLGSTQFDVTPLDRTIVAPADAGRMLVVITTNEERELPGAFVRRCVVHCLQHPAPEQLAQIAALHLRARGRDPSDVDRTRWLQLANQLTNLRTRARNDGIREPSTAEYLDAVHALDQFGDDLSSQDRALIERLVLTKRCHDATPVATT